MNSKNEIKKISSLFSKTFLIDLKKAYDLKDIEVFVKEDVCDNNLDRMLQFCDLSTIEDRMYDRDVIVRDYINKKGEWYRMSILSMEKNLKGFPTKVLFAVQKIASTYYLKMLEIDINNII